MTETVLVTGGTGFIGSWAIVELLRRGYAVRTTVRGLDREGALGADSFIASGDWMWMADVARVLRS